jgi:chromate reductase
VFLDTLTFTRPEIFVGNCASKFDDKGTLTDEATRGFIKSQLEAFAKFIARHGQKA